MRSFIFLATGVLLTIAGCTKKSAPTAAKNEVMAIIAHGQGRMPAFANKFSEKEIVSVANFVASLKK